MLTSLLIILLHITPPAAKAGGEYTYRFIDASVAPQYNRNYTITVKPGEVHLVIDSYGNSLLDEKYKIKGKQWSTFVSAISNCHLAEQVFGSNEGCTGGTSETFALNDGNGKTAKGMVDHCGGKTTGTITGNLDEAAKLFRKMVPDFDTKLEGTREK
jgi:hypothetical protein